MSISVVILAKNEEENLRELLPSLAFADEVLVIDDDSSDKTAEVSRKMGARVLRRDLNDDYAQQRNYGLQQAKSEWVLFLDADERLSATAVERIEELIASSDKKVDGYSLKREDIFWGKRLKYGETGNMHLVRLGRKDSGVFKRQVHEVWDLHTIKKSGVIIEHYSHEHVSDFSKTVKRYAFIEAKKRSAEGARFNLWEMMFFPAGKFFHSFIVRRGFLDGIRGFIYALLMSYHSFLVRFNLLKRAFSQLQSVDLIRVLLMAVLTMLPFGQLFRVQIVNSVSFYLFEPLILLIGIIFVGERLKNSGFQLPQFSGALFALVGAMVLSLLVNSFSLGAMILPAFLYFLRFAAIAFLFVVIFVMVNEKRLELEFSVLTTLGVIWAIFGLVQYLLVPDLRWLWWFGWDEHYFRLVGTLLDPAFTAALIGMGLLLRLKEKTFFWWGEAILLVLALVLTFSRSGWAALAVGLIYLAIKKGMALKMLVGGLIFLSILLVVPKPGGEGVNIFRTFSITSRLKSIEEGLSLFERHPLFGVGYNAYSYRVETTLNEEVGLSLPSHANSPDNSLVLLLSTAGILGGLALLWFWWSLFTYFQDPYLQAGLIAIVVHSMSNNTFFYPFVLIFLGLMIGVQETILSRSSEE